MTGGVEELVGEQQLREVNGKKMLGDAHDEEFLPRLLEEQKLVGEWELSEGREVLQEVDVHEEELRGGLADCVDGDERMCRCRRGLVEHCLLR